MPNRLPNLLIIGAQKCGTTWLYRMMGRHPDIFFSKEKELQFFGGSKYRQSELDEYAANFADAGNRRYAGEATPQYFWSHGALPGFSGIGPPAVSLRRVRAIRDVLGPNVKLILSLRQPVHRAVSAYMHHYRHGRVKPEDKLLDFCEKLLDTELRLGIIDMGFYRRHLWTWEQVFGPDKILTLFMDDIRTNPNGQLERIFAHLDLPPAKIDRLETKVHGGFNLALVKGALSIDKTDPETRQMIHKFGLGKVGLPRIRPRDIFQLQKIYAADIDFIEDRFNRRDLGWHVMPQLEDFLGSDESREASPNPSP